MKQKGFIHLKLKDSLVIFPFLIQIYAKKWILILEIINWYFSNSCCHCWKSIQIIFSSHIAPVGFNTMVLQWHLPHHQYFDYWCSDCCDHPTNSSFTKKTKQNKNNTTSAMKANLDDTLIHNIIHNQISNFDTLITLISYFFSLAQIYQKNSPQNRRFTPR